MALDWMNYHHLYYFKVVAQEGSIARASEVLRLGQPAISAQIKSLEESLGIKLFHRSHKKLELTEAGKVALSYAEEIFRKGSELLKVIQGQANPTHTHLRIGALDSIPKHLIASLVQAAVKAGNCTVTVTEDNEDSLITELVSHHLDLVVTNRSPRQIDPSRAMVKTIGKSEVIVAGGAGFAKVKAGFPGSLSGQPFVLPTLHSQLRTDIAQFFELNEITPDVVAETQDTSLKKILGQKGVGLIVGSRAALQSLINRKELVEIGALEGVYEEFFIMAGPRKIQNSVAQKLFTQLKVV